MATVETPLVGYLTEEELRLIFEQTSESTREGRRDSVLLRLLYDTAARVQELCDMKVRDVRLDGNPHVMLHGKGNKSRYVPIVTEVARDVERYISENGLNRPEFADMPLFTNRKREKLSRAGVAYIVKKYADAAREKSPKIPKKVTPHMFRHTKATHLCQAGIDVVYIRDILGHCHVTTTEIYMKLNVEQARDALEDAYPELPTSGLPDWRADDSLMKTLNSL
ncbi:MAG: tyrosine-type recombinase/integrase [Abditibacteriota bacterium]|nr:tyrosine-type recombinase/integrase [Abditibacteriota bacterium]